jgi:D-glycero-D-manno-heptose 1,7-bisphosphate phosphatase
MSRAVFLDRDGVINAMVYNAEFGLIDSPANPDEFQMLSGVVEAIRRINAMGFLAIVISNQPGVAKGKFTVELLEATREKMFRELALGGARLDDVYYCLHHPHAMLDVYRVVCDCRKPKPGLLQQAAAKWDISLSQSYFIGDGITDIVAGRNAGCKTFLVNSRKCYLCDELARQEVEPDYIAKDLADAVEAISRLDEGDSDIEEQYRFRCKVICD